MKEKSYVTRLRLIAFLYHTEGNPGLYWCKKFVDSAIEPQPNKYGIKAVKNNPCLFLASADNIFMLMQDMQHLYKKS
jgi:hypothetical protein